MDDPFIQYEHISAILPKSTVSLSLALSSSAHLQVSFGLPIKLFMPGEVGARADEIRNPMAGT